MNTKLHSFILVDGWHFKILVYIWTLIGFLFNYTSLHMMFQVKAIHSNFSNPFSRDKLSQSGGLFKHTKIKQFGDHIVCKAVGSVGEIDMFGRS
jgi:hypothetical protein